MNSLTNLIFLPENQICGDSYIPTPLPTLPFRGRFASHRIRTKSRAGPTRSTSNLDMPLLILLGCGESLLPQYILALTGGANSPFPFPFRREVTSLGTSVNGLTPLPLTLHKGLVWAYLDIKKLRKKFNVLKLWIVHNLSQPLRSC